LEENQNVIFKEIGKNEKEIGGEMLKVSSGRLERCSL
jgi:hypothetical protein